MKIPGSVIQKCNHGVYLASSEEVRKDKATYCGLCTPEGAYPDPNWNKVVEQNERLKREFDSASCPKCGSQSHFVEGKHWVCGDCENEWKPPRKIKTRALVSIRSC
jgi:ribosomal protein S27AE